MKRVAPALVAAAFSGAALGCSSISSVEAEAGASASRWRERGEDGALLLRESGTLRAAAGALQAPCLGLWWRLRLQGAGGERAYSGRSTSGAPLATRSTIGQRGIELQGLWPLAGSAAAPVAGSAAASPALAIGGSIGWRQLERRLHDAGVVRGYDERFQDLPLTLVVRWQRAGPLNLTAEAQLGSALHARMRLALPNADAAWLRLARPWLARTRLGVGAAGAGGQWQAGLQLQAEAMGAGPSRALLRNGVPVAAAFQPRTAQQSATLFASWTWALR